MNQAFIGDRARAIGLRTLKRAAGAVTRLVPISTPVLLVGGCTVTKIVDFFVDPCCKDTSTLALNAQVVDLRCFNIPEGQILASGERGSPEYMYSLNGGPFQPNPLFPNLDIGNYTLTVQDIKGCTQFLERIINEPPPIIVDAGIDQ